MTPTEFLTGWAALIVVFVLIISRIPRPQGEPECPPHEWSPAGMGDHPRATHICVRCFKELRTPK